MGVREGAHRGFCATLRRRCATVCRDVKIATAICAGWKLLIFQELQNVLQTGIQSMAWYQSCDSGSTCFLPPKGSLEKNIRSCAARRPHGREYAGVGITFVGGTVAFCLSRPSFNCSNASYGSGAEYTAAVGRGTEKAAMYWSGGNAIMNSSTGFTTGFSLFYSNPYGVISTFEVFSGLNGTGSLLGSFDLGATTNGGSGCFSTNFCPLVAGGVSFSGTGQSVRFTGGGDALAYDDITFGSTIPGVSTTVPEPSSYALMAAGLGLLGVASRRRRRA